MPDVSSLYPQPPAAPANSLASNPLQVLDAIGKLNQNALFQQEFNARRAVGRAYQNAIDPNTGTIDTPTLMRSIGRDPDAAFRAGEASAGALSREGQAIANTTAQFEQKAKQNQFIMDGLGTLADKPNLSMNDVHSFVTTAARNTGIPSAMLLEWQRRLPRDPAKLRESLVTMRNLAVGSNVAGGEGGTIGFTQEGAPIRGTRGQSGYATAGGIEEGATKRPGIAAPAPGQIEAATAIGGASAQASNSLRSAADSSMVRKGMLGNLEEDLQHFTAGPGAEWNKVAKAWANRNLPLPQGWQFDPKSIASQEAFNKQATMLAQQQFATIGGTGTDAKFSSAFETNPNETLSQLGNQNIIRMLKGNEDAIQAKQKAWLQWRKNYGPQTYDEFSQDFNQAFDPRTFQFKYMTPKERQSYVDRMDPRDRGQFVQALTSAHKRGWITAETQ